MKGTLEYRCKHPSGDFVGETWVCGHCFRKLEHRPRDYKMVPIIGGMKSHEGAAFRQEVVYTPVMVGADGTTLGDFIMKMARRLMARGGMPKQEAMDYAIDLLHSWKDEFEGAKFLTEADPWALVDEDMDHWERDGDGSNG